MVSDQQMAVHDAVAALDPAATVLEIQDAMVEANTTNDALSYAMLGDNTYVLFEADGASNEFDPDQDVLIEVQGVTTGFDFNSDVLIVDLVV